MGFASDDDDDIYDSKHRLKGPADLAWKKLGTMINIKNYFTDLLYYRYKPELLREFGVIPIHQLL